MRQTDIQTDSLGAHVKCTAIGSFHHAGSAARHDHQLTIMDRLAGFADQLAEFAGDVIIVAFLQDAFGNAQTTLQLGIIRFCLQLCPQVINIEFRSG